MKISLNPDILYGQADPEIYPAYAYPKLCKLIFDDLPYQLRE